jgi:hypothetical protein
MIDVVYYAHSMKIYNTEREKWEIGLLQACFPEGIIYSPNRLYIQHHKKPMQACLKVVKDPVVTALAFSTNDRKYISLGVYAEIRAAQKRGIPIYEIGEAFVRMFSRGLSVIGKSKDEKWAEVL